MPKKRQDNRTAIELIGILILATLTIHAMFWTFNTFDPVKPQYKNIELQFGFELMHILLFFWMIIAVLSIFWGVFARSKRRT